MTHTLPPLPYAYNALEPHISEQIMTLHHTKHHQGYVNALNAAEEKYLQAATPKERIALQAAIKFNGGGKSRIKILIPHRMRGTRYVVFLISVTITYVIAIVSDRSRAHVFFYCYC